MCSLGVVDEYVRLYVPFLFVSPSSLCCIVLIFCFVLEFVSFYIVYIFRCFSFYFYLLRCVVAFSSSFFHFSLFGCSFFLSCSRGRILLLQFLLKYTLA